MRFETIRQAETVIKALNLRKCVCACVCVCVYVGV